ncbi:MAG: sulfatase-like hydrolase/transferase [Niabella sp.]
MKSKKIILSALLGWLVAASAQAQQALPNILWITSDDNSPFFLGCYGSDLATTPNLDGLAKEGFRYTHAYANAPVCAPSRNTIITGVYASSGGNHHMRSNYAKSATLQLLPAYFRKLGYYCTNNVKEDYNIEGGKIEGSDPGVIWDESSLKAHYKNRKPGQPFFAVFNTMMSHESSIHAPDSGRTPRHDPAKVKLPPYHPDTKEIRYDWARYYDVVENMDAWVGERLKELDDAGLADNTIVIYYSDHGGILARSKRYLYETGLHVPFIIRIPEKYKHLYPASSPGDTVDRMISLVDLLPTMFSIVGEKKLPAYLQGHAFLGPLKTPDAEYVYSFRGRMDERTDMMRSVKDKRFRYIRNYYPYRSNGIYNRYMWRALSTRSWHEAYLDGKCNAAQSAYFEIKPVEELYDTENDYWEVNNLANKPEYKDVLLRMRAENNRWTVQIRDAGFFPEGELKKISQKQPLYDYMRSGKESIQEHIAAADLANFATVKNANQLINNLGNENAVIRYWAALGLRKLGQDAKQAIPALTKALNDASPDVVIAAAEALYFAGLKEPAVKALVNALQDPETNVRLHALNIIDITCKYDKAVLKAIKEMLAKPALPGVQFDVIIGEWMLETGTAKNN